MPWLMYSFHFVLCVHSGDEVWRPGAMDEDPNKTTSSASDGWGATNEPSEPTTFGATTTDADGKCRLVGCSPSIAVRLIFHHLSL